MPKRRRGNITVGEQTTISDQNRFEIETLLEKTFFPEKTDLAFLTSGHSITLGIETVQGCPRLSSQTNKHTELLRVLLDVLRESLGDTHFR